MIIKGHILLFLQSTTAFMSFSSARSTNGTDVGRFAATRDTTMPEQLASTPSGSFNIILVILILAAITFKILERSTQTPMTTRTMKPSLTSLQIRFLTVFWTLRCADWLQGPYFYEMYASKVPASFISKLFVIGFASAAIFGAVAGRAADTFGRKKATLAYFILYALGSASTKSNVIAILFLGRILSGIATSLMFSAPEAWLVAELQKSKDDEPHGDYALGETFGLAYAGDSIVAILAGQLAAAAASQRGPTGPFELSILVLVIGGILAALMWGENVATSSNNDTKPSIQEALQVIRQDPRIVLVGAVQSLFEASMYIFIMAWPPTVSHAIEVVYGCSNVETPYGSIFSCFMACCWFGSALFGRLAKMGIPVEESTASMLTMAALAMGVATKALSSLDAPLASLVFSYLAFEACVGFYFPSIGSLRSKYVPDAHRSIVMNLFGIPLNILVVSVFLLNERVGESGSLGVATAALNVSAICMFKLAHSMPGTSSRTSLSRYK